MPSIGVSEVFVEGTGAGDLRTGPGHYPATPLPGERGTVAIAGHRTTYGAPFRRVDQLERGDRIELRMPYGRFVYRVERTRIVPPTETSVTARVGLRPARALRLPSALLGGRADHRLRAPGAVMRKVRVRTPSTVRRSVTTYVHMTALAVRYETGRRRRFERRDEARMVQMEQLRERIERDEYAVDAAQGGGRHRPQAAVTASVLVAAPRAADGSPRHPTPGTPVVARPIHVTATAASTAVRAASGAQKHSS